MISELMLIFTTMPDDERADTLARTLVDEELAACVHVHPAVWSTYRWKGAVEREQERPIVIKTTRARISDVRSRLLSLHPYELPEFVVLEASSSDAYGAWARENT